MSNYFDHPAISQTKLKELKKSPKHFWAKYIDPNRSPEVPTKEMAFGTAAHTYLLESHLFAKTYVEVPNIDKRTKPGKALIKKLTEENPEKIIISSEDIEIIKHMCNMILSKRALQILLSDAIPEKELYWTDKATGIECKMKADLLIEPCRKYPNGLLFDYKTTTNASYKEFIKTAYDFGYYNQEAFYCEGFKNVYQTKGYPTFIFGVAEKTPPFDCNFYNIDLSLEMGLKENRKLLDLYNNCLQKDNWPGYEDEIQEISFPNWIKKQIENNLPKEGEAA